MFPCLGPDGHLDATGYILDLCRKKRPTVAGTERTHPRNDAPDNEVPTRKVGVDFDEAASQDTAQLLSDAGERMLREVYAQQLLLPGQLLLLGRFWGRL